MKKTILKSVLVAFVATTSLFSCSNDNDVKNAPSNTIASKPTPPGLGEFYYRYNGVLPYTSIPESFAIASNNAIYAMDGSFNVIKIPLSSLAVGTYFIGGSNIFTYNLPTNSNTWYAYDGYVKITENNSNQISGIFKVEGNGIGYKGVTSISGYFNSVSILP